MRGTKEPRRTIAVELLALDLDTCRRCRGTAASLDEALAAVAETLRASGAEVRLSRTVVRTAEEAERLRFVASPTIRVDGRDIALELRESACADCGELCGCDGGVACRVWVWRGREHLEAPKEMIVDAVLAAVAEGARVAPGPEEPYRMPENLRRFFEASSTRKAGGACCAPPADAAPCCGGR